jgi:hypothetical protein
MEKRKKYRESIGRTTIPPGNLAEQVQHGQKATHMWRTPDAHCDRGPSSEERMKMKLDKGMPISLNDQVKHPNLMWPTPRANTIVNKKERLSPEGRLSKDGKQRFGLNLQDAVTLWPTPTSMDSSEDPLKSATKLMQGKTHRSSGEKVQVKLSDKVMMEEIEKNPELMKIYQDHQIQERENLPPQGEFVDYLRSQVTIKELVEKTTIKKTTIEHWFRKDKAGFSHPSMEHWKIIKPFLKEVKYNKEMTTLTNKEWTMWRTPDAAAGGSNLPGIRKALDEGHLKRPSGQQIQIRLQYQVQEPRLWPTPVHSDHLMNKSETLEAWKIRAKKKKEENGVNLQYALRHAVQEEKPGGTLSPNWVEWLMGYPTGHTDLKR